MGETDTKKIGKVFNIQRFSLNDGPGLRVIVFLKGCPLSCKWCSNPESQSYQTEILYNSKNCIDCHDCQTSCSHQAIDVRRPYKLLREHCTACTDCVQNCFANALTVIGEDMTVAQVMEKLEKEDTMFRYSGGGVTLSGGEPLMQADFAMEIFKACKANGWNTAIETTGYASEESIRKCIPYIDLVLMDFKQIDSAVHKKFTGVENERIKKNARLISSLAKEMIARVPVIPMFNADRESIYEIGKFVKTLPNIKEIHLLPYHRFGLGKYKLMGWDYGLSDEIKTPDEAYMKELKEMVTSLGLTCNIGAI